MIINVKKGDAISLSSEIRRMLDTQLGGMDEDELDNIMDFVMEAFNQYLVGKYDPRIQNFGGSD